MTPGAVATWLRSNGLFVVRWHLSRKRIILALLAVLLLGVGIWIYSRRISRVNLESYVPESALGFVEINDLLRLVEQLTQTEAWQQLAPAFGLSDRLRYLSRVGVLARLTGIGSPETLMLARAQYAIVVTGIEVRGDEVKPRLAVIAETHTSPDQLREVIEQRLPQLARYAYGQPVAETTEYGGVPVTIYRTAASDRRLLSAQIKSEWIIANHPDPLRACIDTRQGRTPSMAHNFYLRAARPAVERSSDLFAFISGSGLARLLQFGAHLVAGRLLGATPFSGAVEGLLADISSRASEGVAYAVSFENGVVVDRYVLLFKPTVVDILQTAITIKKNSSGALSLVPPSARDVTLIKVEDPGRALDGIEMAIASQIGVGQSIFLRQFMISAREALLGLKAGETAAPAIGGEVLSMGFTEELADRVILIAVRDRAMLTRFVSTFLSQGGATIRRQDYQGVELLVSSNRQRGAAAFINGFLALGAPEQLRRLIEAQQRGESLVRTAQFAATSKPSIPAVVLSFSSVREDAAMMMTKLARRLGGKPLAETAEQKLQQLPLAASATALNELGVYIESHAPLGNFPFIVSLLESAIKDQPLGP